MVTLYERLHFLCEKRGIKGAQMCRDIGASKSLMTDLKSGRKKGVNAETAQKLAAYFGVSVGYLLGEDDKKIKPATADEPSENVQALIEFVKRVPDHKAEKILRAMQLILEDD